MFRSTGCSFRGLRFGSQHLHDSKQPFVTPVPSQGIHLSFWLVQVLHPCRTDMLADKDIYTREVKVINLWSYV